MSNQYCWRCWFETGMLWQVYPSTNRCQYCRQIRTGSARTKQWLRRWVRPKPYPTKPTEEAPAQLKVSRERTDWRYRKST